MARWAVSFDICMRLHILFSPLLRAGARAVQNSQPRHHTQVKTVDKRSWMLEKKVSKLLKAHVHAEKPFR